MITTDYKILKEQSKELILEQNCSIPYLQELREKLLNEVKGISIAQGLSAIQIGTNERAFIYKKSRFEWEFIINPEYTGKGEKYISSEGCLSFPDSNFAISRYKKVIVKFQTLNFKNELKEFRFELTGSLATVFQHETNHCNGITMLDSGIELNEDKIDDKLWWKIYKYNWESAIYYESDMKNIETGEMFRGKIEDLKIIGIKLK